MRDRREERRMYDVIVAGAGPAGSTAARLCAEHGLRTLLLEKEKIPREKPCAGGLSIAASRELGLSLPANLIERRCRGMRLVVGETQTTVETEHDVAFMVRRSSFDAFLAGEAARAGAEIHEEEGCTVAARDEGCVSVGTKKGSYRAKTLIGADGYFSAVAKVVRPPFSTDEIRFCLIADIPLPGAEIEQRLGDLVEIDYGVVELGYAWLFPKRDHVAAGVGGSSSRARSMKETFIRFLRARDLPVPLRMRGCYIPISRFRSPVRAGRVLLAGDAAGFVDSFSGEGIRYAAASGRHAAEAVIRFEGDERGGDLGSYEKACRRSFIGDLRSSNSVTDLSFRHPGIFLAPVVADRKMLLRYLETMTGSRGFREYARGLALRFPFLLARGMLGFDKQSVFSRAEENDTERLSGE